MFGLLLLIVIYLVLGFMYAWIAGVVAREEISVGTGVFVVLLPGVVRIALAIAGLNIGLGGLLLDLALLTVGGALIAKLEWRHAAIIAAVYTVLLFLVSIVLGLLFVAAT